jgi:hypothetical protein
MPDKKSATIVIFDRAGKIVTLAPFDIPNGEKIIPRLHNACSRKGFVAELAFAHLSTEDLLKQLETP